MVRLHYFGLIRLNQMVHRLFPYVGVGGL